MGGFYNYTGTAPLANDTEYGCIITATDSGGTVTVSPPNFDTINPNYYTWEAVDWDYNGGFFVDNPTGVANNSYTVGSYCDLPGISNIDVSHPVVRIANPPNRLHL